jgi:transposase
MAPDKKGALEQNARIVFMDETGISKTPNVRRSWSLKGKTPILKHRLDRERLNTIAALDCRPDGSDAELMFYMQPQSIKSQDIIAFLEALHQQIDGKIVLIWDSFTCHRSKIVKEHIASCRDWLRVERFPVYAPELNPVEYLFSSVKGKDTANLCAVSVDHIAHKLMAAVDRISSSAKLLYGFLKASGLYAHDGC